MRTHQDIDVEEHIEQHIDAHLHFFNRDLSLDTVSIESHVPVSQVVKEFDQLGDNGVELVLVHFLTDVLNQVLEFTFDPAFSQVESRSQAADISSEDKWSASLRFKFADTQNEHSISIVPWDEDISHDAWDTFFFEA